VTQDNHIREGVATFNAFNSHVSTLDHQLQGFANAIRQLGSSVGLLNATYYLRGSLIQIEYLFRENVGTVTFKIYVRLTFVSKAADLFSEISRKRERSRDSP
jgi:hypothetical protein